MDLKKPIAYAQEACETMMRLYPAEELPPKGRFHYHQGVFLSGMCKTAALCGESRYTDYAGAWLHSVFSPDGSRILQYDHADLDDIQPGILLYPLWDATGDAFYRTAMDAVMAQVPDIPRCECGGFYHKVRCTGQMWLDGLYMACPFIAEYARRFERPELMDLAVQEILLMRKNNRDPQTGLWYHAWDETRQTEWADPETGCSSEFWGRSMGWVPVAILDVMEQLAQMPGEQPDREGSRYQQLAAIVKDLLEALSRYQSPDGRWYQVVNKPEKPGNWLENSCSCLYAAAMARGVRRGVLDASWLERAGRAFSGVVGSLTWQGENIQIGNVCIGTGVGDYDFYCARPVHVNDLHGVGAFLLMCTELQAALDDGGIEYVK
ncbi:MAG: glycoside hydrolase family 88 protein [Butyrivibrio sp.]|nr:glycoside hydrolase family 88 protein [Acetatifactor muris]MCM1559921.1 glycoside hydrolase family 88 protein [Butyrivibrio sp.]